MKSIIATELGYEDSMTNNQGVFIQNVNKYSIDKL